MTSPRYTELPGGYRCADCYAAGRTHGVITDPDRHDSWHRLADGWAPRWSAERPAVTARPGRRH